MSKETKFLIFCLEWYKNKKQLTGKQTMDVFKQYDVIDYVIDCYEALHTTGVNYIVEDIDSYIAAKQN
ncbi:protein DUF3791 [Candidatus Termititenax spirochaetophilus]|uniref:Protein DUF3791 n=1 Tax=Candidatus Termititenax spirochaetophilus TaxID=2218522 RepID=A0A388T6W3_9BACT|nr:protein DUF3791 [Candidatus Termititenax spirochaetophilus]